MNKIKNAITALAVSSMIGIAVYPGVAVAQQPDDAIDPEAWVYESIVKDGKLRFDNFARWGYSEPVEDSLLSLFVKSKLGCNPPIGTVEFSEDLAGDWSNRMTSGRGRIIMVDGQYVVGEDHMYKFAVSKSMLILDVVNRWAAFGMTHNKDYWHHEDGARRYRDD